MFSGIDALIGPGGNYTAEAQKIASVNVTADTAANTGRL